MAPAGAYTSVDDMSRLETRRTLVYIYTYFGSECPFGMGVNGRRPPSCVRGAPTVLKGAEVVVRRVGMAESMPPERDVVVVGRAAVVMIPSGMAYCKGGTEESAVIAVASDRCAAAMGVLR